MQATLNPTLLLVIALAPLVSSIIVGLFGRSIGRSASHWLTTLSVGLSFVLSLIVLNDVINGARFNATIYEWMVVGKLHMEVGFMIDGLSALMMAVVTFVSLAVHIYTIGYMADDDGYQRFFSYISLFTFSMLMLVMSNNMLQLFFGWEAVGLVSYLLIGFWYTRPTAVFANMKAFIVNRVGDFGFILGIGLLAAYTGSLNYTEIFAKGPELALLHLPGTDWMLITVACISLFIGAMGKSAQFPLHVWLPDSMEGPTPISALIHAATMVTAGIFMVARMSPLFELSNTALSFILVIGAITALFMGILGVVQTDIKRVIAYSTLSQLGYMTVALGASAYSVAIFHLMTHAFFKALLFLAAGSVIIGMHHDQDMRHMGGLRKYMPITWITFLIGGLALSGIPPFAGFFSKDSIIEAVHASDLPGAGFAYFAVLSSVFVTALYTFRMYFMVFHGEERFRHVAHDAHGHDHAQDHGHDGAHEPHESPWVVTVPLIMLAIPSVLAGYLFIQPLLYGHFFGNSIFVNAAAHPAMSDLAEHWHGQIQMMIHGLSSMPLWLALAGIATAYYGYMVNLRFPQAVRRMLGPIYTVLENNYFFDWFNQNVLASGMRLLGTGLWKGGDVGLIDGLLVNGTARVVGWTARVVRLLQTGYIYYYALAMIAGVVVFMGYFVPGKLLSGWFIR
ncbi:MULTISPECIES: NADH-quinone oxidoreductase subunit L [unclassified Thiomonas]|jgi:NADH-quinone oxidoreductase subunit L|uniref:NADH-quinone oxidoreductase subunit L n=1 Tax=unclassified Thiomonas TaxID=2625466 RepID=UPI0004DBB888|nr:MULTISPECIES: NADH-quinone oxidoreductase subunit L [unclassified Thiomonas]MDD4999890.1 NADH-quinone oxidoreductase subunit L [Thiomonas arsenitoxydans]OZB54937.1 MAG: NADH-quinone oxidoreductase subunit L [Thiomonas sp. 15-63-373]CQR45416.1 NADH-quinone oxidoreductase subunit L [Thiomonas sp. CB3]CDW93068.1 NADH-quinone oxidoreductase subunit L [Thiomonas sp. CB2]VDY06412.1 NADH-quinone oxidoreductase subunit L [Thiomonas sp. Bio17B3]